MKYTNTLHLAISVLFCLLTVPAIGQIQSEQCESEVKPDHTRTEWYRQMYSNHPNVLAAERAFLDYFATHPEESTRDKKRFIRWLQNARLNMDGQGFALPFPSHTPFKVSTSETAAKGTGSWFLMGPNHAEKTQCGTSSNLSGGFCDRVFINPYNTNNLIAGFSYGGLWVSQDQGASWELTDAAFANGTNTYANRDYYYGDISTSKANPQVVVAATEAGLLKSSNGGSNWLLCPQLNREANNDLRPYFATLSQADPNLVLATFGRKVFRSMDGGNTWETVFDNSNGGPNHYFTRQYNNNSTFGIYERTYNFFGLQPDYDDPQTFYLGIWNANDQPCVYKSSDNGASFNFLVNLDQVTGRELPKNLLFKTIENQPDRFYVSPQFGVDSIYRFAETGNLINKNKINALTVSFGQIVNNVEYVAIDFLNEQNIYAGFYFASSVMKSTNGGISFGDRTSGYSGCPKYVHPDVRCIDVVGDLVLIGSDGGLALSKDGMNTVTSDIGREISSIDLWGFSSSPKSDIAAAGCDHGPTKIRRFAGENGWISVGGGDAADISVNQSNDRWIYYRPYPNAPIHRVEIGPGNQILPGPTLTASASLHRVEFHPNLWKTAFALDDKKVSVSRDNFLSIQPFVDFGQTVNVFKIAPHEPEVMYALLGNRHIQRSGDGGNSWQTITPPATITMGVTNIVDIAVGTNPNHLWAAYGNFQNSVKVLRTKDGGITWENITTNDLPPSPASHLVYQPGTDGGVYLGFPGPYGVWYQNDQMDSWQPLGNGLPALGYIQNMFVVAPKGKIRMGSSRGSWEHNLYEESLPEANFAMDRNQILCQESINFVQNCVHSSGRAYYWWSFPGGNPGSSTDPNPRVTYPSSGQFDVYLEVTDEFGNKNSKTLKVEVLDNGSGNCEPLSSASDRNPTVTLNFYPNPANSELKIDLGQKFDEIRVVVTSTSGQTISTENLHNKEAITISTGHLPDGMYMIFLELDGQRVIRKFIKE